MWALLGGLLLYGSHRPRAGDSVDGWLVLCLVALVWLVAALVELVRRVL